MINRENMLEQAANLIETKLTLLGATAIEDQLQDEVRNIFNLFFSFFYQFVKKINFYNCNIILL